MYRTITQRILGTCLALWFVLISAAMPASNFCEMHGGFNAHVHPMRERGDMGMMQDAGVQHAGMQHAGMQHDGMQHAAMQHNGMQHADMMSDASNDSSDTPPAGCCCICVGCCSANTGVAYPSTTSVALLVETVGRAHTASAIQIIAITRQAHALPFATAPPRLES